jgi:ABC-2 type transport system ATP-binding protein
LELWEVITELRDQGTTIVLTTQYLEEADQLAQSISVIDGGHIIAEGTADQLKAKVGGNVLEITVADRAELPAAVAVLARTFALDESELAVNHDLARIQLPLAVGGAGPTDALRALDEARLTITDFTLRRPSLDDVFLSLTGRAAEDVATSGGRPGKPGARKAGAGAGAPR